MDSLRMLNYGKTISKNGFKNNIIAHSASGCPYG